MFDFHKDAKIREPSCECRRVQKLLVRAAVSKKRSDSNSPSKQVDILITPDALQSTLNQSVLVQLLRCRCDICYIKTQHTPRESDLALAGKITALAERRELTAALVFAGGTFALRLLNEHRLYSIEATLSHMRDRNDLTRELFRLFEGHRAFETCRHINNHTASESILCLTEDFLQQLYDRAIYLRVPSFQADNLLQRFRDPQNMPFIDDAQLPIGRREGGRSFYKFQIHDSFCDAKLKGRSLFRKQIDLFDAEQRQQATQESAVLKVLKELAHPNIAEVLFAFQEEQPPRLSLVFDYHPFDLDKILFHMERGTKEVGGLPSPVPDKVEDRFPGSVLNDWLWIGLLDIFDAVAAVHEPLLKSLQRDPSSKWLGAHFDIKPANIIVTAQGRFLLTDFGLAYFKQFNAEPEQETNFTITAGTSMYAPPPSYSKRKAEDAKNTKDQIWWKRDYDVWSLACVASELLAYLVDPKDSPTKFRAERQQQENFGFWTYKSNRIEVKDAVVHRLKAYHDPRDPYLTRVAEQLQKMFSITRETPITVKACQRELSVGVSIDRYLLQDLDDEIIAGPGTYSHLRDMRTSFSTRRVASPLRCCLYLWRNTSSKKVKLDVEFSGSNGETFIVLNWTNLDSDEFLAPSLFDPNILYEENRLRTNGLFLECAFRSMHDGFTFHFARRDDYYHFLGAMTHQHVEVGSEFRFRRCKIKSKRPFLRNSRWEASDGHLQVWGELTDDDYRTVYIDPDTRDKTMKQSQKFDNSSSRGSSDTRSTQTATMPSGPSDVRYRLALFLCGNEASSRALALISLNHRGFLMTFDHSNRTGPRMDLVKRSGMDIWGTILQAPMESVGGPGSTLTSYPGFPLNPKAITESIENLGGFGSVELTFRSTADSKKFEEYYEILKRGKNYT